MKTPGGVIIYKEYNSEEKGEPDKPLTPAKDSTGHTAGVQAVSGEIRVDSNVQAEGSIMKKLSQDLVNKSRENCDILSTAEKEKQTEELD